MTQKKRPQQHGPSASTILIVLAMVVISYGFRLLLNGEIHLGSGYDAYAGPVLPLTSVSGGDGLEVKRYVDFDFSTYGETHDPSVTDPAEVMVTDTYQLTNPTNIDKTAELAYPYEIQTIMERGFFPTITVAGQEVQTDLYFTMDAGRDIQRAKSFEKYRELMTETDYFATAMEEPAVEDIPVKAYHFTDITYTGERKEAIPFLTLSFTIPEGVNVWVRYYDVLKSDKDHRYTVWFRDTLDERDGAWLFVSNGDIENLTFGGNLGHNLTKESPTTDVEYEYEMVESTFSDLMWKFAEEYDFWEEDDYNPNPGLITPEILYRDTMKRIGGTMGDGYDPMFGEAVHCVDDKFYATFVETRLQYMVFPVTIPAGETVEIQAQYWKESSYDFYNPEIYPEGYELATQLGSNLSFTHLSASIQNTRWIEIQRQDMGFDLSNGITQATLDPETEQYTLVVYHKDQEK